MKQVCQGKIYNTETSEILHSHEGCCAHRTEGLTEDLYVTKKGNYFVAYEDSKEMREWAVSKGIEDAADADSGICPLTEEETVQWLADRNADDVIRERFAEIMDDILEEA